ncbi:MAG: START-like domain-containing protein [Bacteroidota bacterium]
MAKNSKVAAKKATKSKVSKAPAKKKPASKKVVVKKAPAKKVVKKVAKPVAKKKVIVKKATKPASKKKVATKKVVAKTVRKAVKKTTKPAPKKIKAAKPEKTVNKKAAPVKVVKPAAKKVVKKNVVTKTVVKPKVKTVAVKKTEKVKAIDKKSAEVKPQVLPKSTKVVQKPVHTKLDAKAKGKPATEEKVEPLQAKAAKVIKELEETMDLNKVRPRLQAGSPPPKPIRHKEPPIKLVEPTNTLKQKYSLEFEFRSSPKILFNSISDASGLAGWFADEVHTKDDIYTFYWDQGSSQAKMVAMQEPRLIRFQWLEDTDGTYFQFEIKEDDITADVALIITDFALKGERETQIRLWESQIQQLKMFVGSL